MTAEVIPTEDDRDQLIAALRARGIRFLAPSDAVARGAGPLSTRDLIVRLVTHVDPRLRLALVPLFILHPEVASYVPNLVEDLSKHSRVELQALYMAAVYLQRLWRTQLSFYLGDFPILPDMFAKTLGLPSPDDRYGKTGLHALADWHRVQSPYPFNRMASYLKAMDLLLEQLDLERKHGEPTSDG